MHNIMAIFRKEMNAFFSSPMAYIFLVVFALINGYFFNIQFFLINESDMRVLFSIIPIVYLFFIPAVSMGTDIEGKRHRYNRDNFYPTHQ